MYSYLEFCSCGGDRQQPAAVCMIPQYGTITSWYHMPGTRYATEAEVGNAINTTILQGYVKGLESAEPRRTVHRTL